MLSVSNSAAMILAVSHPAVPPPKITICWLIGLISVGRFEWCILTGRSVARLLNAKTAHESGSRWCQSAKLSSDNGNPGCIGRQSVPRRTTAVDLGRVCAKSRR